MWRLSALVLALLLPFVGAQPGPGASEWNHYVGTLTQGEVDDWLEWAFALFGDDFGGCTMAETQFLFVLRLHDAGPSDVVSLGAGSLADEPAAAVYATGATPAVVYARNADGCPRFAVAGAAVEGTVGYTLDITQCGLMVNCGLF